MCSRLSGSSMFGYHTQTRRYYKGLMGFHEEILFPWLSREVLQGTSGTGIAREPGHANDDCLEGYTQTHTGRCAQAFCACGTDPQIQPQCICL